MNIARLRKAGAIQVIVGLAQMVFSLGVVTTFVTQGKSWGSEAFLPVCVVAGALGILAVICGFGARGGIWLLGLFGTIALILNRFLGMNFIRWVILISPSVDGGYFVFAFITTVLIEVSLTTASGIVVMTSRDDLGSAARASANTFIVLLGIAALVVSLVLLFFSWVVH